MLKANKKGELIEFSLKQRQQWLTYNYDYHQRSWPRLPLKRVGTPYPFVEQPPTMPPASPPKLSKM